MNKRCAIALTIALTSCNQISGVSDFVFTISPEEDDDLGSDSDSDSDSDGDGDSDSDGDTDPDVEVSYVMFCNQVSRSTGSSVLVVTIGGGDDIVSFSADTNCCTECKEVLAGDNVTVTMYSAEDDAMLDTGSVPFFPDNDHFVLAYLEDGKPKLGTSDLTGDDKDCDYIPVNFTRCGN